MKNRKYWMITSIVTLLPALVGLLLWEKLPGELPIHFGPGGADGWGGKAFGVFGVPLMLLAAHWLIYAATMLDKQNQGHNRKVLDLVGLLFPAMSLFFGVLIYSTAMGREVDFARYLFVLLGLFFLLMGNWLPKLRQNATLGIKLKWTLYNEENWNKTHRLGGFVWVICGLIFCVMGFVPEQALLWLLPGTLLLMIGVPTLYSWNLARKQRQEGTYTESEVSKSLNRHPAVKVISMVLVAVILIVVGILMFTGDIEYNVRDGELVIDADYWSDLTVSLDTIDSAEYRDTAPVGSRDFGWGSPRLLLGMFSNEEFGSYTRYTYAGTNAQIILHCADEVLVLNAEDEAATQALFEAITAQIP